VTYRERQRLADIQAAIDAIRSYLQRGDLSDGLVFDAVRIRLLEIGEAVKALPAEIPWPGSITAGRRFLSGCSSLMPPSRLPASISTGTRPKCSSPDQRAPHRDDLR